jgi:hypothetical protein
MSKLAAFLLVSFFPSLASLVIIFVLTIITSQDHVYFYLGLSFYGLLLFSSFLSLFAFRLRHFLCLPYRRVDCFISLGPQYHEEEGGRVLPGVGRERFFHFLLLISFWFL